MGASVFNSATERAAYEAGVREALAGDVKAEDAAKRAADLFPDRDALVVVKSDGTIGLQHFHVTGHTVGKVDGEAK